MFQLIDAADIVVTVMIAVVPGFEEPWVQVRPKPWTLEICTKTVESWKQKKGLKPGHSLVVYCTTADKAPVATCTKNPKLCDLIGL